MDHVFPVTALLGGALIGLSVVLFALLNGRLLGVSGIVYGLLDRDPRETGWRCAFLGGLMSGGLLLLLVFPQTFAVSPSRSLMATAAAGLLVGFGSRLGNGCTSGHGVCGVSRLSPRSIAATLTFIATGMLTVLAINTWFGGSA
ncbi:MAG: YeeE/YedE family protein [Gammaproteobacteria bacterium]